MKASIIWRPNLHYNIYICPDDITYYNKYSYNTKHKHDLIIPYTSINILVSSYIRAMLVTYDL